MKDKDNLRLFLVSLELSAVLGLVLTLGICVMGKTTKLTSIAIMFLLTTAVLTTALYIRMRIEMKRQKARQARQELQNQQAPQDLPDLQDLSDDSMD